MESKEVAHGTSIKNVFKGHIGWTAVNAIIYYPDFPLRVEVL